MLATSAIEKGLPTNVDAERFVLGSILLDDTLYVQAAGTIEAKPEGYPLISVEPQTAQYVGGLPKDLPTWGASLPSSSETWSSFSFPSASASGSRSNPIKCPFAPRSRAIPLACPPRPSVQSTTVEPGRTLSNSIASSKRTGACRGFGFVTRSP